MKILRFIFILSLVFSQYDFNLQDLNINSAYFEDIVGPSQFENEVSLVYFGHFTWGTCTARFEELNDFYQGLISSGFENNIKLFGVGKDTHINNLENWTDQNVGIVNADTSPFEVWNNWDSSQRDLFILDHNGNLQYHNNITSGISEDVYVLVNQLISEISSLLGDINIDGEVNVLDVIQTVNIILGTSNYNELADINDDNMIDILDVVQLVNIILN